MIASMLLDSGEPVHSYTVSRSIHAGAARAPAAAATPSSPSSIAADAAAAAAAAALPAAATAVACSTLNMRVRARECKPYGGQCGGRAALMKQTLAGAAMKWC